jgi:hypothetical protein
MANEMSQISPYKSDLQIQIIGEDSSPIEKHVFNLEPETDSHQNIVELKTNLHNPDQEPKEIKRVIYDQNYIEAFINNKFVSKVLPDIMNWINIGGNVVSFAAHALNFNEPIKNFSKTIGAFSTKSFMVATSFINIVERCYAKNFLSALGFFNDIIIAGTVSQKDTYLARGTASGTYNMGNSLADSVGRSEGGFQSVDDHVASTFKAFKKFFANLFSKNIVQNFTNHENGMWAIFGGLGSNIGALAWLFGAKPEIPTIIRDVCGVMMDIEQLNPGHLKSGRKNFFWSGISLAVGTTSDLFMRFVPQKAQDLLVPMTFIFDGLGRHLLRLDRNERELEAKVLKPLLKPSIDLHKVQEKTLGVAV